MNNYLELHVYKRKMAEDENLTLLTINKQTGGEGVASFLKSKYQIKVFEGNGDGSDDKVMHFRDFKANYDYLLVNENELLGYKKC